MSTSLLYATEQRGAFGFAFTFCSLLATLIDSSFGPAVANIQFCVLKVSRLDISSSASKHLENCTITLSINSAHCGAGLGWVRAHGVSGGPGVSLRYIYNIFMCVYTVRLWGSRSPIVRPTATIRCFCVQQWSCVTGFSCCCMKSGRAALWGLSDMLAVLTSRRSFPAAPYTRIIPAASPAYVSVLLVLLWTTTDVMATLIAARSSGSVGSRFQSCRR